MRRPPYPASEEALIERTFGREAVEGRTLLCAGSAPDAGGEWNVAVVRDVSGAIFLLESRNDPAGASVVAVTEADQTGFARVFERAGKAAAARDFDVSAWVDAERAVAASDPDFDFDLSMAAWDRIKDAIAGEVEASHAAAEMDTLAEEDSQIAGAMAELVERRAAGMRPS